MSTYESLKGLKIKYLSSDTSGDRIQEGEIFYNSVDFNLKGYLAVAAWHSGANMNTARGLLAAGGSSPNSASVVFGGAVPSASALTEEYNGSGWAESGDMSNARKLLAGLGIQTAALATMGDGTATTAEEYNGTSWTTGGTLNVGRGRAQACGTQTAGLAFGGEPNDQKAKTEEYDGSSWTAGGDMNAGRQL